MCCTLNCYVPPFFKDPSPTGTVITTVVTVVVVVLVIAAVLGTLLVVYLYKKIKRVNFNYDLTLVFVMKNSLCIII